MRNLFEANTMYTDKEIDDGIGEYRLSKDLCEIYGIKNPEDADCLKLNFTEAMMLVSIGYRVGYEKGRHDEKFLLKHIMGKI